MQRTLLLALAFVGCFPAPSTGRLPEDTEQTAVYHMQPANRGTEHYSAWFGDSDGKVFYFGLSPFWELWWATGGDARVDLTERGDHLIGRFDLTRQRFLAPLRVRELEDEARSSVWDVLAHSNGRVYFTTYFEEIGFVDPNTGRSQFFEGIGVGFNELVEGPDGSIYVTRYSDQPRDELRQTYGALVILSPQGKLLKETRFEALPGAFTAPKSVAVDPQTGEVWLNTDTFSAGGTIRYETLRLTADGQLISRRAAPPELHFVAFDRSGRGYFAEDHDGRLRLRITSAGRDLVEIPLGDRAPLDFVQDIKFSEGDLAAIALWSGRVVLVSPGKQSFAWVDLQLAVPPACAAPHGRSLLYTAVVYEGRLYATLFCGGRMLSLSVPPPGPAWHHTRRLP